MVRSTQISRLDGLMLFASVDEGSDAHLSEVKSQAKQVLRKLTKTAEPQASIECGQFMIHYLIQDNVVYLCIANRSFSRKLAFAFLDDIHREFTSTYAHSQIHDLRLRPYAMAEFDSYAARTKQSYNNNTHTDANSRASAATAATATGASVTASSSNLDRVHSELRDVTQVMTKNIEDLLYRGDNLERMGELSSRLRDDSKKYRRAAVRINWELLVKQYGPFAALGFIMLLFIYLRFF